MESLISPLSVSNMFSPFSASFKMDNIFDKINMDFSSTVSPTQIPYTFSPNGLSSLISPQSLNLNEPKPLEFKLSVPVLKAVPTKKELSEKKKKKKTDQIPVEPVKLNDRSWSIIHAHQTVSNGLRISITNKTRCEEPSTIIPDTLYSSLKYEIRQTISGNFLDQQFILARISVNDTEGTIAQGEQLLKGLIECALTKDKFDSYEGTMKAQFSDCSYHHKKGDFCWQIDYFFPSDLENSILTVRSAPFKVLARKPTKEKRKGSTFDEFTAKLEELVKASKKLKTDEKKVALNLVSEKFTSMDPAFLNNHFKK